jgi:hypothetical protein
LAKRLYEIEQSLYDLYKDIKVSDLQGGQDLPITVFVERPDIEEVPKRVFPSISVNLIDMEFEPEMDGHFPERTEILVDQNNKEITSRKTSHWYRLSYQIHAWSLYAKQDRDLVRRIENRISPRDGLTVLDESYWIFRANFVSIDEVYQDRVIYHKVWTYEILADIDNSETDRTDKMVEEIYIESSTVQTKIEDGTIKPIDSSGNATSAKEAKLVLHREFRYNDQQYWFPQD